MTAVLEVRGISKSFGGLQALHDCSLRVEQGSITALIGPNGSGKTTLFNVITGYVAPDAGTVTIAGDDVTGARPEDVFAKGVGRTFQLTRIFGRMTVLENMLVATQRNEGWLRSVLRPAANEHEQRRAYELLDFVGLTRLASARAASLSYGQRKLLELAYVLVADPTVILLDEPAGGVNPTLINQIRDRIIELNARGTTFLVIEHNMEFVMSLSHQVTCMHQGAPIVTGTPDELRSDPRVLDAYLGGDDEEGDDDVAVG